MPTAIHLLAVNEAPKLIYLNGLARHVAYRDVQQPGAILASKAQHVQDRAFVQLGEPCRSPYPDTLGKQVNHWRGLVQIDTQIA
jgi:hypothetical protein